MLILENEAARLQVAFLDGRSLTVTLTRGFNVFSASINVKQINVKQHQNGWPKHVKHRIGVYTQRTLSE